MPGGQGGLWYTNTYNDEPDEEKGLPFHLCCYRNILLQAIRHYGIINKPTTPAEDDADAVAHATCHRPSMAVGPTRFICRMRLQDRLGDGV